VSLTMEIIVMKNAHLQFLICPVAGEDSNFSFEMEENGIWACPNGLWPFPGSVRFSLPVSLDILE
ncbi:hypothetical protein P4519_05915, partial [Geobacillus stearothermophilus]|uniref:hypothetical protein n=1 Tax=Geobacillus stearothermophilus TaxID=1422 RepID=UPI002E1DAB5A|nr:hypothetical protein [Geobacillus stearothermophilus]